MSISAARFAAGLAALGAIGIPLAVHFAVDGPPWQYLGTHFPPGESGYAMMRPAGHLAFGLLFLQILVGGNAEALAARLAWPNLVRFHRRMGLFTILLAAMHPLLFLGGRTLRARHFAWQTLLPNPFENYWERMNFVGALTLYTIALAVAAALLAPRLGPRWWRRIHALNYAAFFLAFWHSSAIGSETRFPAVRTVHLAMVAIVLCQIAIRIYRQWVLSRLAAGAA